MTYVHVVILNLQLLWRVHAYAVYRATSFQVFISFRDTKRANSIKCKCLLNREVAQLRFSYGMRGVFVNNVERIITGALHCAMYCNVKYISTFDAWKCRIDLIKYEYSVYSIIRTSPNIQR